MQDLIAITFTARPGDRTIGPAYPNSPASESSQESDLWLILVTATANELRARVPS